MSEPVILPEMNLPSEVPSWAMGSGAKDQVIIRSLYLNPENQLEIHNIHLQEKYSRIRSEVRLCESYRCEDAEHLIVAYGTPARISKSVVDSLRASGVKIGLFRPISLWPFCGEELFAAASICAKNKGTVFVPEMAMNQLQQDVELSLKGSCSVVGINKLGGAIFTEEDILKEIKARGI